MNGGASFRLPAPLAVGPRAAARVRRALQAEAVRPLAVDLGVGEHAVVATVDADSRERALHALRGLQGRELPVVQVALIGARGQVGSALRALLARERAGIAARTGLDLRLRVALDRHGVALAPEGLPASIPDSAWSARSPEDWARERARWTSSPTPVVLVDCTASDEIAAEYESLLTAGVGVVTPNKRAGAGCLARYRRLRALADAGAAPWRYETTVGAALPVLSSLRSLVDRGERVLSIEGVLSGSLSYILARLHEGAAFSRAVDEARSRGYTEPDPREDLAALDLTRKLVILARECGAALDADQVAVEPLVDVARWSPDSADGATDFAWRQRADDAEARGRRLVAVVSWDVHGARVGVRAEALDSPLARVRAGENLLRIRTEFHDRLPLLVAGPGAGPEVTAAGVLSDLIAAARELVDHR
jgi:aspartokinase/homoserine dehydrogenase 1